MPTKARVAREAAKRAAAAKSVKRVKVRKVPSPPEPRAVPFAEMIGQAVERGVANALAEQINASRASAISVDMPDVAPSTTIPADSPGKQPSVEEEIAAFERCQAFTSELLEGLAKRIEPVLRQRHDETKGGAAEPARSRSGIADWVAHRNYSQAALNSLLLELHARLDLP